MEFCDECDNYLELKMKEISSETKLVYCCKYCGFEKQHSVKGSSCIYKNFYNEKEVFLNNKNIQYIDKDSTLPRVSNIACPNEECPTLRKSEDNPPKNEVVYIITNEQDMIFQYLCCHCKTTWMNR